MADENDILNMLKDWLEQHFQSSQLVFCADIDQQRHLGPTDRAEGIAKDHAAYIKHVANELGYEVEREGTDTILCKSRH
jgi:hypothetical protein